MNNKIKELSEKQAVAMVERLKARQAKEAAEAEYREKSNIFNEITAQLKQAVQEEAEKWHPKLKKPHKTS